MNVHALWSLLIPLSLMGSRGHADPFRFCRNLLDARAVVPIEAPVTLAELVRKSSILDLRFGPEYAGLDQKDFRGRLQLAAQALGALGVEFDLHARDLVLRTTGTSRLNRIARSTMRNFRTALGFDPRSALTFDRDTFESIAEHHGRRIDFSAYTALSGRPDIYLLHELKHMRLTRGEAEGRPAVLNGQYQNVKGFLGKIIQRHALPSPENLQEAVTWAYEQRLVHRLAVALWRKPDLNLGELTHLAEQLNTGASNIVLNLVERVANTDSRSRLTYVWTRGPLFLSTLVDMPNQFFISTLPREFVERTAGRPAGELRQVDLKGVARAWRAEQLNALGALAEELLVQDRRTHLFKVSLAQLGLRRINSRRLNQELHCLLADFLVTPRSEVELHARWLDVDLPTTPSLGPEVLNLGGRSTLDFAAVKGNEDMELALNGIRERQRETTYGYAQIALRAGGVVKIVTLEWSRVFQDVFENLIANGLAFRFDILRIDLFWIREPIPSAITPEFLAVRSQVRLARALSALGRL